MKNKKKTEYINSVVEGKHEKWLAEKLSEAMEWERERVLEAVLEKVEVQREEITLDDIKEIITKDDE